MNWWKHSGDKSSVNSGVQKWCRCISEVHICFSFPSCQSPPQTLRSIRLKRWAAWREVLVAVSFSYLAFVFHSVTLIPSWKSKNIEKNCADPKLLWFDLSQQPCPAPTHSSPSQDGERIRRINMRTCGLR